MALSVLTNFECNSAATALNVNGGGFNPANANFLTDGTVDTNTGNTASPVFSSASYNFVAGDVGHWLFVKTGTNTIPGYYQIASVASNKATLTASIGSGNIVNTTLGTPGPRWTASTVAGIATVGTPTGITFGVDYSRSTTAKVNGLSDFNAVGSSTNLTSATAGFTPVMVGNIFHQTTTGTGAFGVVGWYEIVSYTNATTVVLDRTPNSGTASVNTTGYVGGAMSLNSTLDDAFFELMAGTNGTGSMTVFFNGSFTLGQTISVTTGAGGTTSPVAYQAYLNIRGDLPTGANRVPINAGSFSHTFGIYNDFYGFIFSGTGASVLTTSTGMKLVNTTVICNSTSAGRTAVSLAAGSNWFYNSEFSSYRGVAMSGGNSTNCAAFGCYFHDSDILLQSTGTTGNFVSIHCVYINSVTAHWNTTAANVANLTAINCTLYGAENKLSVGMTLTTGNSAVRVINSIFYGFVTAMSAADATQTVMFDMNNNFFNNTADGANWKKGPGTTALNPTFTSVSQITGTGGTSTTNVLSAASGTPFSVLTANTDYIQLVSGSGTGFAAGIYLVTSVGGGGATATLSSNITSAGSGSAIVWQATYGRNLLPTGTNMAGAFPGMIDSIPPTGGLYKGAYQPAGGVSVDPGIANVRNGTGYTINGSSLSGTLVVPSLANTKTGVAGDGGTGTYDGSDRWTDPGETNVRLTTAYKANSTSNNKTGTLDLPATTDVKTGVTFDGASKTGSYDGSDRWTDPGVANVRLATAYKANSTSNNRTGTARIPAVGSVKIGVVYDSSDSLTGTYDGSDRWTDPGATHVEIGTTYKANSTTNNRTGTLDPGGGGGGGGGKKIMTIGPRRGGGISL